MYTKFFGLHERPFTLLPDPSFLYWSKQHARAFAVLEYGVVSRAPITLITGEVGSGKTTLVQKLLSEMEETLRVGLISNAQGGRGELMRWVLNAYGLAVPDGGYVGMFQAFQNFLVSEYAQGRRTVLIVDEAQNLSLEGLEEIRMLTNINSHKDELLQLVLVGQPELRDMILRPELRQFAQRVAASFHLAPMDRAMTGEYIAHRLRIAGGSGEEFTVQAVDMIFCKTGGVPRLVNQLCDFSMLYAWSGDTMTITAAIVNDVLDDGVFFAAAIGSEEEV